MIREFSIMVQGVIREILLLGSKSGIGILYFGSKEWYGNYLFRFKVCYWNSLLWDQGVVQEFFL